MVPQWNSCFLAPTHEFTPVTRQGSPGLCPAAPRILGPSPAFCPTAFGSLRKIHAVCHQCFAHCSRNLATQRPSQRSSWPQGLTPASPISTHVSASPGSLSRFIHLDPTLRGAYDAHQFPLGPSLAAIDAHSMWHPTMAGHPLCSCLVVVIIIPHVATATCLSPATNYRLAYHLIEHQLACSLFPLLLAVPFFILLLQLAFIPGPLEPAFG